MQNELSKSKSELLWQPSQQQIESSILHAFMGQLEQKFDDYQSLWQWSNDDPNRFWEAIWDFCGIVGDKGSTTISNPEAMPGAKWFPEASLNFSENLLKHSPSLAEQDALVFWGENEVRRRLSHAELSAQVSQCQQALVAAGIKSGDRVAAYLPNCPEAIVAMLATASLGAVWCSASPDFGVEGVVDRFGQIEPTVLFCCNHYYYNGKQIDCQPNNRAIADKLSSIESIFLVDYGGNKIDECDYATTWSEMLDQYAPQKISYKRLPFDHPLYILFSSGTTGAPKCIVHGAGGTLIQHLKEHQLQADIQVGDRLFYFTTLGWMMWNWLASGLASGATLLLYDGSPFASNNERKSELIFDLAEQEKMTQLGTSAKFLEACNKAGLQPGQSHDLSSLRSIFSTGSPLAPESFRYVYREIKQDLLLSSISGGTDIISCFALGAPILPVWIGELQCLGLGMAVDVFDAEGNSMPSGKGDLVCTKPFPSMPIGFWGDTDGSRYRAAYFEKYENVWCHGDYVELTEHGGMIIHGRSDAVLNPGGVRIGTAEIYRQVEKIPEVIDSVVIGQQWQSDVRVILFVVLREELELDDALVQKIKQQIRSRTTPRHVPSKVIQVADVPRTKSGKIVELAVRDVVHGRDVKNRTSLANPEALQLFEGIAELNQ